MSMAPRNNNTTTRSEKMKYSDQLVQRMKNIVDVVAILGSGMKINREMENECIAIRQEIAKQEGGAK